MSGVITLFVAFVTALIITPKCYATSTIVIIGPSGVGKSSLINFLSQSNTEVAKEGVTYDSETLNTTLYHINTFDLNAIDTSGLMDTSGYTNDEIAQLIKVSLIEQHLHSISGVVLMFDATQNRLQLRSMMNGIIQIFGEQILKHLVFAFNKNDQIETNTKKKEQIIEHCINILSPIYEEFGIQEMDIKQRIIFLDTKGAFHTYSAKFIQGIENNLKGNGVNIIDADNEMTAEIEKYYKAELDDNNNYKIWTEKIPHSEIKEKTVMVDVQQTYSYQCNCVKHCNRIGFVKMNCKSTCGTCTGTKMVSKPKLERHTETWYENVTKQELKYEESYLHTKAEKALADVTRNKIYAALQSRNTKTEF